MQFFLIVGHLRTSSSTLFKGSPTIYYDVHFLKQHRWISTMEYFLNKEGSKAWDGWVDLMLNACQWPSIRDLRRGGIKAGFS
jgi:hypothetical protein